MKPIIKSTFLLLFTTQLSAQVGIGTTMPHSSAKLEVSSTTQGFLPPRTSLTATNAASPVTSPATGLLVFNTAPAGSAPNNVVAGYYYWDGTSWVNLTGVPYTGATKAVNLGAYDLTVNTLRVGAGGGGASTQNVTIGYNSLSSNTGSDNIAIGYEALKVNGTGVQNVSVGSFALSANTAGFNNVAVGYDALKVSNTSSYNTAVGNYTLRSNLGGEANTAIGYASLASNTSGIDNVAAGYNALNSNETGSYNIAIGSYALDRSTNGGRNTAIGYAALTTNRTGTDLVAIGYYANTGGTQSSTLTNSTVIGAYATVSASNTISIGNENVTSWAFGRSSTSDNNYAFQIGSTTANGNGAYLTKGGVWTNASSREFKEDFETIDNEDLLEKINKMSITKWKYKGTNETHIGPMAEEFKELFDLGIVGENKSISTIDASGIALSAIQALYKKNQDLEQQIEELKMMTKKKNSLRSKFRRLFNKASLQAP
jgi:hypothetical protein